MADKNRKTKKRKWTPVVLNDPTFFSGDMEGFVSLEVMEEYNLEELKEINVDVPPRKKKAKVQAEQVNLVMISQNNHSNKLIYPCVLLQLPRYISI